MSSVWQGLPGSWEPKRHKNSRPSTRSPSLKAEITFTYLEESCAIEAACTAKTVGKTGVEMEALTGVNIALLTIYDMCKAVDKAMRISDIRLCRKTGGKSGTLILESEDE